MDMCVSRIVIVICFCTSAWAMEGDWPTHLQDNHRSGVSPAYLSVPMRLAWTYKAPTAPEPAWTESPAIHDYLHDWFNLKPRQNFDACFATTIARGRAYFGSSVTGEIVCLSLADGKRLWSFFTDGPVRFAPTIAAKRVYCGSDDGFVYCLDAQDGSLVWSERAGGADMIWGNEQLISVWPVRTSVLVQDGSVYWAAGLFPREGLYLCQRNAGDGQDGWTVDVPLPPQGYLLATHERLFVPSGKTYPMMFTLNTGEFIDYLHESTRDGGAWAIILPGKQQLASGPTVTGSINFPGSSQPGAITKMKYANCLIADDQAYYFNTNTYLARIDVGDRSKLWHTERVCPYTLVMDQRHIYAGGDGEFSVLNKSDGRVLWSAPVSGKVYGLAISKQMLLVCTDQGHIYAFQATLPALSQLTGVVTGTETASVTAKLHAPGDSPCRVFLYYGTENGGSDETVWQHAKALGTHEQPALVQDRIGPLQPDRLYYVSMKVTNASGSVWVEPTCVMTAPLRVQAETEQVAESPRTVKFLIRRSPWAAACEMPVNYRLIGSASGGEDYNVPAPEVILRQGETEAHLSIDIQQDLEREQDETIRFQLEPGQYQTDPQDWALLTIQDNDRLIGRFAHRMRIQFSGYVGNEVLTNVPVLIRLRPGLAGFDYGDLHDSNGGDLVFTTADGENLLAYEIEHWDTKGESLIWVCVPNIRSSQDAVLAWWGNSDAPQQDYNAQGLAWPGYAHVWHLNETAPQLMDSVNPRQTGSALGDIQLGAPGRWGTCLKLDGDNDTVKLNRPLSIGSGSHTITVWARVPKVGSGDLQEGERVGIVLGNHSDSPNSNWEVHAQGQMRVWWNNGQIDYRGSSDLRDGQWHCLAWVRDREAGEYRLYLDGTLDGAHDQAGADITFTTLHQIGGDNRAGNSPNFHGLLDEMRVANRALSRSELQCYWESTHPNREFISYLAE